jgi:hypothetical protein
MEVLQQNYTKSPQKLHPIIDTLQTSFSRSNYGKLTMWLPKRHHNLFERWLPFSWEISKSFATLFSPHSHIFFSFSISEAW